MPHHPEPTGQGDCGALSLLPRHPCPQGAPQGPEEGQERCVDKSQHLPYSCQNGMILTIVSAWMLEVSYNFILQTGIALLGNVQHSLDWE